MLTALLLLTAIDVSDLRQLFIDRQFVASSRNVTLELHPPRKTGDITLTSESPLSLGGTGHCVLYDNGLYHFWYSAGEAVCHAQSRDGIHWDKPADPVGLGRGRSGVAGRIAGPMVFIDPNAPQEERFRLVARAPDLSPMLQVFSSEDGIDWKHTHRDVIVYDDSKPHHLDSQNVIFWDPRLGRYAAYVRFNRRARGSLGRSVVRAEAADLAHFPRLEGMPVVMQADDDRDDIYTNGTLPYPWAANVYLMFPTLYYHYGNWQHEFAKETPVNAGVLDVRFASSRDGITWEKYGWARFVSLGMEGEFDSRRIYMARGIVPALNGREMYMYYMGTNETHGWGRDDRNNRLLTAAGLAPRPVRRAISRMVLRRDGFVSVRAPHSGGEFATPPLRFHGARLALNIDTAAGEARVEIQDEAGGPIPGFTLEDCDLIHTANEIDRTVTWNGGSSVAKLAGRTVRLRFSMRDTDLYAFQFQGELR